MRLLLYVVVCATLTGCAGGGSPIDQARNDHDLGVFDNAKLALASQVATDRRNVDAILP